MRQVVDFYVLLLAYHQERKNNGAFGHKRVDDDCERMWNGQICFGLNVRIDIDVRYRQASVIMYSIKEAWHFLVRRDDECWQLRAS